MKVGKAALSLGLHCMVFGWMFEPDDSFKKLFQISVSLCFTIRAVYTAQSPPFS